MRRAFLPCWWLPSLVYGCFIGPGLPKQPASTVRELDLASGNPLEPCHCSGGSLLVNNWAGKQPWIKGCGLRANTPVEMEAPSDGRDAAVPALCFPGSPLPEKKGSEAGSWHPV